MSQVVTIAVPAEIAERARMVAERTQRRVEDVLLEWLDRAATEVPVEWLPDAQIEALCDLQLNATEQANLSVLLVGQRERALTGAEQLRLAALLETYRRGMVRKAQAMQIAVTRGLRPPLAL